MQIIKHVIVVIGRGAEPPPPSPPPTPTSLTPSLTPNAGEFLWFSLNFHLVHLIFPRNARAGSPVPGKIHAPNPMSPCLKLSFFQEDYFSKFEQTLEAYFSCTSGYTIFLMKLWDRRISIQWRRLDFFEGGTPRPIKGYHAPPAEGPGAKAPRTVAKFHFLKRFKVLKNESIFQKYQHFSCPKNPFF